MRLTGVARYKPPQTTVANVLITPPPPARKVYVLKSRYRRTQMISQANPLLVSDQVSGKSWMANVVRDV